MPYLAAIDISVLGTGLIYRKHQTGVHRVLDELLRQFHTRDNLRLEFVSAGRAPWLEFPSRLAFERGLQRNGWDFRSRRSWLPGLYSGLLASGRAALFAKEKGWISEKFLVAFFQALGWGLRSESASFSAPVYYSPAHALPNVPVGVRRCITIHDMIPVKFPEWYDETQSFRKILGSIDGKKDHIIADSECSRRDWLNHSGAEASLASVIPCGVSEGFFPRVDSAGLEGIKEKYGVDGNRFILAVGTFEPRKNLGVLVRAFLGLRKRNGFGDMMLLLVGPKGWKTSSLFQLLESQPEDEAAIRLSGFVPDTDLPWLYSACEVFVFPSLYEGFGLPVAEAMRCGAAVLCGRNSSLPEVAGDAAEYIEERNPESLEEALSKLLQDRERLDDLREKAKRRSEMFSWKKAGAAYLDLFASLST